MKVVVYIIFIDYRKIRKVKASFLIKTNSKRLT